MWECHPAGKVNSVTLISGIGKNTKLEIFPVSGPDLINFRVVNVTEWKRTLGTITLSTFHFILKLFCGYRSWNTDPSKWIVVLAGI